MYFKVESTLTRKMFQSLFPSLLLGGLGGLGIFTFGKKIDEAEMRADDAFFSVKDNVERRSVRTL